VLFLQPDLVLKDNSVARAAAPELARRTTLIAGAVNSRG